MLNSSKSPWTTTKSTLLRPHRLFYDDAEYLEAKELFINEDGIPYGAVMYGLFLNHLIVI